MVDGADGGGGLARPLPRPPSHSSLAQNRRMSWGLQRPQANGAVSLSDERDGHERTENAGGEDTVAYPSMPFPVAPTPTPSAFRSQVPPPLSPARRHRELSLAALTGGSRLSVNTAKSPSYPSFHRTSSGGSHSSRQSIPEVAEGPQIGSSSSVGAFVGSPPRHANGPPVASSSRSPAHDDQITPKRPPRPTRASSGLSSMESSTAASAAPSVLPTLRLPVTLSEDSPQTRAQMHSLNRRLSSLRPHVKTTKQAAEEVTQLLGSLAEAEQRLQAEMSRLGDLLEDGVVPHPGGLRRLWAQNGVVGRRMKERQEERESLEQNVVGPLRAWGDALKEAERDRLGKRGTGFEEEVKAFQQYQSKYLSTPSSRDTPRLDAAHEKRQRDSDILRFQIQSHFLDLTFGPRFTALYASLLNFPSFILDLQSVPPMPNLRQEMTNAMLAAVDLNTAVQDWPMQRMRKERELIDASNGGSAVVEEDWESIEGSSPGAGLGISADGSAGAALPGGERKRDRLGSKLRAAVGNLTSSVSGNRSPSASPSSNGPSMFASTSQALPAPPRASMSRDEKRRERHSIQVLPKSSSAWGLASAASSGKDANAVKGIRDLNVSPSWLTMKENEGRKKEGWLWCSVDKKGSVWERCWCEIKQSHLFEHRPTTEGGSIESEVRTDLMFASAREVRKSERRFVFEVITSQATRRYQATSDIDMHRWLAALGNAIEASITGTASIRGARCSASPSISSLISSDDIHVLNSPPLSSPADQYGVGVGIGLGLPSPQEKDVSSGGFPGLRGWGNDLSRKVSLRGRAKHLSYSHSPCESANGVHDIRGPAPSAAPSSIPAEIKKQHHRSHSFFPQSSAGGGPKLNFISPSPIGTPTQPSTATNLLPPLDSTSRLSFDSSNSDRSSSRRSSLLMHDEIDHRIDRFVNDLAASSSPNLSALGHPVFTSSDRRAVSESSTFDSHPAPLAPPAAAAAHHHRPLTIRDIVNRSDNVMCLDCRRPNPKWATISLNEERVVGFMCIECSGVHRSLGSHVSKVRSVDLDNWKDSDIAVAARTGNAYINSIWEAHSPRPEDRAEPKKFIEAKYIQELWRL